MPSRTEDLPPLQRASKRLLGARYRMEIAVWIAEFGSTPINPTQLRAGLDTSSEDPPSHSSVVAELEHMRSAGLLSVLTVPGRDVYFERTDSVYWEGCLRLRDEVLAREAGTR